jgi:imidazolonepropionase-like amidohydrolase
MAFALAGLALATALAGTAPAQTGRELSEAVAEYVTVNAPLVALTNVQVVDGTGAPPIANATIVIRDGVIVAVGTEIEVPRGAEILDLSGHTLIPGIVGLHDHTFYTTAGRVVQTNETAPKLLLDDPEEARRVVGYWADEGATWFKVYTRISRADLAAVIDEAHARGRRVTGHICSVSFREAVELGIDNLEHGFFTNSDYFPGKIPDTCPAGLEAGLLEVDLDGPEVQATFREMVEQGVAMTSTLAIYETFVPNRPPLEERVLELMAPEVRTEYLATREQIAATAGANPWPELFARAQAYEKAFVEAGGLLAAGVDPTGIGGALAGLGDQRNLELLVEAGFTPVEAIEIMTANGARVLGEYDRYGSIEPGKLAELVVIDGDPVARPAEIRNVTLVFKDGLGYDAPKLIQSTKGIVGIR